MRCWPNKLYVWFKYSLSFSSFQILQVWIHGDFFGGTLLDDLTDFLTWLLQSGHKWKRFVTQLDFQAFASRYLSIFLFIYSAAFSYFEKLGRDGKDNKMMRIKVCQKPESAYKCEMSISSRSLRVPKKFTKTLSTILKFGSQDGFLQVIITSN